MRNKNCTPVLGWVTLFRSPAKFKCRQTTNKQTNKETNEVSSRSYTNVTVTMTQWECDYTHSPWQQRVATCRRWSLFARSHRRCIRTRGNLSTRCCSLVQPNVVTFCRRCHRTADQPGVIKKHAWRSPTTRDAPLIHFAILFMNIICNYINWVYSIHARLTM